MPPSHPSQPTLEPAPPELELMSFETFLEWHPQDGQQFQLINGIPQAKPNPTGPHENICGYLAGELFVHLRQFKPNWYVPKSATIKPIRDKTGYKPDVIVLDRDQLREEPLWNNRSSLIYGATIPLVIEVVSQNWRDDYDYKFSDYEAMGIQEYWIVDFRALGAARALGQLDKSKPKQATITVCELGEDGYELRRYQTGDRLVSRVLPELQLAVDDIFAAAE